MLMLKRKNNMFKKIFICLLSIAALTTSADAGRLVLTAELPEQDRSTVVKKLSGFEQKEDHKFLETMVWKTTLMYSITEEQALQLLPFFQKELRKPIYSTIKKTAFALWVRNGNKISHRLSTSSDELEYIVKTVRSQEDVRKIIVGPEDINLAFKKAIPDRCFSGCGTLLFGESSSFHTFNRTHQYYERKATSTAEKMENQSCHPDPLVFQCTDMIFQYMDDYEKPLWCQPLKFGDEEPNL